ncbi:MAG: hypothetical protein LBJ12_02240 [Oscillospiraceae bacterium]|jgi:hypothetical protein|nr:hypothetical protein [Oscillospiraceae bacterium]
MKKFTSILLALVLSVGILTSIPLSASAATQKAIFPMQYLNISQGVNGQYSHQGDCAIDITGKDTGIDNFFAPFTGTIKRIYGDYNTVWFQSNEPVQYANGTIDYMTIMVIHDNNISDLWVGKVVQQP